jgi:uncharacterized protein (DUF2141 family)
MNMFKSIIAGFALQLPALAAAVANQPSQVSAQLEVAFTGVETQQGMIMMVLFNSEATFDGGAPVRMAMVPAEKPDVKALFDGLPTGWYAIKAFHDLDGDGKMSTNPFGIPTEPFAFSNNAKGAMGPAKWADAAFDVIAGANNHGIIIQ